MTCGFYPCSIHRHVYTEYIEEIHNHLGTKESYIVSHEEFETENTCPQELKEWVWSD